MSNVEAFLVRKKRFAKNAKGREVSLPLEAFSLLKTRIDDRAFLRRLEKTRRESVKMRRDGNAP